MRFIPEDIWKKVKYYLFKLYTKDKTDKLKNITDVIKDIRVSVVNNNVQYLIIHPRESILRCWSIDFCEKCGNYTENICHSNCFCYCDMPELI
jgi:hypothetical protein